MFRRKAQHPVRREGAEGNSSLHNFFLLLMISRDMGRRWGFGGKAKRGEKIVGRYYTEQEVETLLGNWEGACLLQPS